MNLYIKGRFTLVFKRLRQLLLMFLPLLLHLTLFQISSSSSTQQTPLQLSPPQISIHFCYFIPLAFKHFIYFPVVKEQSIHRYTPFVCYFISLSFRHFPNSPFSNTSQAIAMLYDSQLLLLLVTCSRVPLLANLITYHIATTLYNSSFSCHVISLPFKRFLYLLVLKHSQSISTLTQYVQYRNIVMYAQVR